MTNLGWTANIEEETVANETFRTVLYTGKKLQVTVMSIPVGETVGWEMHEDLDQFLRVESGSATVRLGTSSDAVTEEHELQDDWAVVVPGGVWHDIVNSGDEPLKLYSIYSPPDHEDGTVHETKADAEADEHEDEDGDSGDHHAPAPK